MPFGTWISLTSGRVSPVFALCGGFKISQIKTSKDQKPPCNGRLLNNRAYRARAFRACFPVVYLRWASFCQTPDQWSRHRPNCTDLAFSKLTTGFWPRSAKSLMPFHAEKWAKPSCERPNRLESWRDFHLCQTFHRLFMMSEKIVCGYDVLKVVYVCSESTNGCAWPDI